MSTKLEAHRLTRKLIEQAGVEKPGITDKGCWALVRCYTGSLMPGFINCGCKPRPGFLTCRHHAAREEQAQALKKGSL